MNIFQTGVLLTAALLGVLPFCRDKVQARPETAAQEMTYYVAFRDQTMAPDLMLTDCEGQTLDRIRPDRDRDAALGPLRPGRYQILDREETAGEFVLNENAAVMLTTGRLWTDGELLYLAPWTPGALLVRCELPGPGVYTLTLMGENGDERAAILEIGPEAAPDPGGGWSRCCQFEGLGPGYYELRRQGLVCATAELNAGEIKSLALDLR